jgi:hypothetical protein
MVIAALSFIFILNLYLVLPEPLIPEYESNGSRYFLFFSFLALAISTIRFVLLLRMREYRADMYATEILGENYITFLKHQKFKSRYSEQKNKILKVFKWLTHPSFDKRLEHISGQSKSVNPVVEGLNWTLIFFFTVWAFFGAMITGMGLQHLIAPDGQLSFLQSSLMTLMVVLSIIAINFYPRNKTASVSWWM